MSAWGGCGGCVAVYGVDLAAIWTFQKVQLLLFTFDQFLLLLFFCASNFIFDSSLAVVESPKDLEGLEFLQL